MVLLVEAAYGCSSLGVVVMCLREGRTARVFTSLPPPLGTAVLGPVPATGDKLLGVNVLPPLAYPEELEVTWKSKLNNALVQLWKVYSKGWHCSSAVKLMNLPPVTVQERGLWVGCQQPAVTAELHVRWQG